MAVPTAPTYIPDLSGVNPPVVIDDPDAASIEKQQLWQLQQIAENTEPA